MEGLRILWKRIGQGFPCLFHLLTGLYCPGCGGTRAVRYLLRGQIMKSFQYHPLVLYAAAVTAAELVLYLLGRIRTAAVGRTEGAGTAEMRETAKTKSASDGRQRAFRRYGREVLAGALLVLVNWVFKNYMLVFRGVDLLPDRLF